MSVVKAAERFKDRRSNLQKENDEIKERIACYIDEASQSLNNFTEEIPTNDLSWLIAMAQEFSRKNNCNIVLYGEDVGVAVFDDLSVAEACLSGVYDQVEVSGNFVLGKGGRTEFGELQVQHFRDRKNDPGFLLDKCVELVRRECLCHC